MKPGATRWQGMALAEALVSMVLLTAGLGAAAAMLVQTLRNGRDAAQRVAAVRLAESLAEDLRILRRPDGRALGSVADLDPAVTCADSPSSCPLEFEAARRVDAWRQQVTDLLPAGAVARVEIANPAIPAYVIRIEWRSPADARGSTVVLPVET